ncbi:MAG: FMN-dependent NADH-azoreductase [Pseudomonas sp.]|uniref:FMN-dependent NADH-azoreductase n=1 Tax=Pseudomonas sp. TaxID=306 RepID=UPI003D0EE50C
MNILHIDCSPRAASQSCLLSAAVVERLRLASPAARVTYRHLGRDPIPHAEADYAMALSCPGALSAEQLSEAVQLSEQLIQELEAADILVIGTPMNNFTVPSVLKAWIDQILRVGRSFTPTAKGKVGLLKDRPVYIAVASGGVFTGERASQPDFLTPYMTAALGCVGLKTLHFLPLQATVFLDDAQLAAARETLLETIDAAALA